MEISGNSGKLSNLFKNDCFLRGHWSIGEESKKNRNQSAVDPESGGEVPSGGGLPAKGLEARHLEDVGSGCEGFDRSVAVGERVNLGLVATEVEWLRLWVAERESVSESAGEARKVAGRVGRWWE
jgi:hypothetical protein